ncbi:MAG TPA: type II secretion system F family protein, partial [Aquifex aeolicus]|nr:type II secretion system F family protein [Aquifex aeolicus]
MKSYVYEGIKEGKRVKGVLKAKDRRELIKKLKYEGIKPIKIEEKKDKFTLFRKKVSEEELSFMLIQLSVLLSSGIPLTRALELLSSQVENELLIGAINQIKSSIEKGENLAEAFRRTEIFPEFLSEMLTAVQRGENLEYIFQVAGEYLQKVAEFKGKVISSITYPTVVILFSFISLFIAVKVVVPKIANVLEGFGKELPFITKFILVFADVLSVFLILSPLVFIVFYFREKFIKKERLHFILLKLPILGKLNLYFNLSRFSRILAMLL